MSDRIFIDTNILIYAYLDSDVEKYEKSRKILNYKFFDESFYISTQVLNEFCAAFTKGKYLHKNINDFYYEILESYHILLVDVNTISLAVKLQKKYSTSWWDALMISSALENKCNIMYTEDLSNIHIVENTLRIVNPLK